MENTPMAIVLIFTALSVTASVFVISACALSSRISRDYEWEESIEQEPEFSLHPARQSIS